MSGGIPFVPLDCQLDEKFQYIEAEFGLTGFAIVVKLFQRIYGGHGYFCEWNDRVALLFAHQIGAGVDVVRETVSATIRERIFDEGMFKKHGILTSRGIQKRYSDVAKRRKTIFENPEYVLLCCNQNSENADISSKNVCNTDKNVCNSNTSKVNELNGSKVNVSCAEQPRHTNSESDEKTIKAELVQKYGAKVVDDYVNRYKSWCNSKGRYPGLVYKNIKTWIEKDGVLELSDCNVDKSRDPQAIKDRVMAQYK